MTYAVEAWRVRFAREWMLVGLAMAGGHGPECLGWAQERAELGARLGERRLPPGSTWGLL